MVTSAEMTDSSATGAPTLQLMCPRWTTITGAGFFSIWVVISKRVSTPRGRLAARVTFIPSLSHRARTPAMVRQSATTVLVAPASIQFLKCGKQRRVIPEFLIAVSTASGGVRDGAAHLGSLSCYSRSSLLPLQLRDFTSNNSNNLTQFASRLRRFLIGGEWTANPEKLFVMMLH